VRYVPIFMQKDAPAPGSIPAPPSVPGAGIGAVGGSERRASMGTAKAARDPLLAAIKVIAAAAGMDPQTGQPTMPPPAPPLGEPLARAPSASAHSHHNHNPNVVPLAQDLSRGLGDPSLLPIKFNQESPYFGFMNHSPHRILFQNQIYPTGTHLFEALKYLEHR
jgi:hypothetical protein